jgi:hypothetical protein
MEGVTTAIVAFVLACVIFPHVIKNKPQYYGAVGCMLLIILLGALNLMIGRASFMVFAAVMIAILQIGAILLLILSAGGQTVKDLAGELADPIEVVRRGGDKEIIVPLRGEKPGAGRAEREAAREAERVGPGRIDLDAELDLPPRAPEPRPPAPRDEDDRGIPLA